MTGDADSVERLARGSASAGCAQTCQAGFRGAVRCCDGDTGIVRQLFSSMEGIAFTHLAFTSHHLRFGSL